MNIPVAEESGNRPTGRVPAILRALRHRNYRFYFTGQLISVIGTWMQSVAQSWLVYRMTGSSFKLGLVVFASQVPMFLLAPIGGMVADRYSRHRVVVLTQVSAMLLAFALAALTLLGNIQIWQIMTLAALLGVVNAFDQPARNALAIEMVDSRDLINVVALNSSMMNSASFAGPLVAGTLVAIVGEGWCFFANAISYVAVIAGLLLMTVTPRMRRARPEAGFRGMAEGFRFAAHTRPVRSLLVGLGFASLMGMPYAVLMPIFSVKILHAGAGGLGLLMSASGAGALAGTLTLAARRALHGLARWVVLTCGGFGLSLILFALSRSFVLSALLLVPVGFCMLFQTAASNTLIQSLSPDALRGRVMSVYLMTLTGLAPFGALLAGLSAQHLGAPITVAIGGAACLIGAAAFARSLPAMGTEHRQLAWPKSAEVATLPDAMISKLPIVE